MKLLKNNFVRCGLMGWCIEVFWTGLGSLLNADRKMTGTTSLLMFPIYGMAALFRPIYQMIKNRNMLFRGGVYTICIFTAEYLSGSLLRLLHMCPWDYSGSRFAIHGLIRLDYAPAWFVAGLLMERIVRSPDSTGKPPAVSSARDTLIRHRNFYENHSKKETITK